MIKKISYLCLAFTFSFLFFSTNVNAYDFSYFEGLSVLTDSELSDINDYLNDYSSNYPGSFNICSARFGVGYRIYLECGYVTNFDNISDHGQFLRYSHDSTYFSNGKWLMTNDSPFNSQFTIANATSNIYLLGANRSGIFWLSDDLYYNGSRTLEFTNEEYSNFNSDIKQYYDFQKYLVSGYPLYSYINLRLGNWRGYNGSVELINCYDNVCDNSGTSYSYKYGTTGEVIDLSSEISSTINDYNLDTNYTYTINAGQTSTLNIYYYSTQISYSIFYYFDNVLQNNLTQNLSGASGSLITLNNLDSVKDNIYFLDTSNTYFITLTSGQQNVINVYYNSIDVNYDVNVFLDDIYYKSYSSIGTGKVGQTITLDNLDSVIDIYTLDEREYEISLVENRELNYVNVYYFSDNYDTKYQDIDTTGKFYISFSWVDIKERFNLNGLYTQTEQFVIVYVVNFLFYAIVCIFAVIGIKMLFRLINFFKMF